MNNHLPVDFNNCDEDGAVRLVTRGFLESYEKSDVKLSEGKTAMVSDGEIFAKGTLRFRSGIWVVEVDDWNAEY